MELLVELSLNRELSMRKDEHQLLIRVQGKLHTGMRDAAVFAWNRILTEVYRVFQFI